MDIGMIVVFFIYGLAFFILGFAILLYPKKGSVFKLAKDLWLIGAFGILHGINEWIDMFILIQKPMEMMPLKIIRMATLPVSFLFLIYFGTKSITENKKKYSTLKALPAILFVAWGIITTLSHNRFLMGDIWARYLLAIPGVLLTSYALTLQIPEFKKTQTPEVIVNLKFAAGAFFFYALFSGFVLQANFFPASFFNYTVFLDIVGIPVQVFRTLIAITMTYSVIQVLGMFELETLATLQTAHDKLEIDITERKRTEEELRKLASFAELNPAPVLRFNPDGRVIQANPAAYQIFGKDTLEGSLIAKILPTMSKIDTEKYIRKGRIDIHETTIGEKDFQFVIRGVPDLGVGHIYGSDITEHKKAEEALQESEEQYRQIVELSPDAIDISSEGKIVFINTAGAKLLGAENPEQLIGKPIWEFLHPDYREITEERFRYMSEKGISVPLLEEKFIRLDGTEVDVEVTATPFTYKGKPATQAIFRDITERKRAAEEIELLQKINNMLNAGVGQEEVFKIIVDGLRSLYNYESVAIHLLSEDKKHLTVDGYSSDSKLAQKLEKLTGLTIKGYKVHLYEGSLFKEVVDTGNPVIADDVSWVLKSYAGRKIPQSMIKIGAKLTKANWGIGVPLLAGDKVVGVIGCGSVEKLTYEDAQRFANFGAQAGLAIESALTFEKLETAYDELKQSDKLKDLFIDIMRHDLLNPAGVTMNFAEMLSEDEKDADKIKSFQVILRNTERIIEMIENASKLAILESGKELEFAEKDLGQILKSITTEMTSLADEKNMKIKTNIKGKFKALVNPLIYDVFSNLLDNAIKYGPEDSEIIAGIEESGGNWKISVADKGQGIPDKEKKAIFNRFKRIEKGAVRGSGLGLAIVKRVVKAHKGQVWVEDTPFGGSIFFVLLKKA